MKKLLPVAIVATAVLLASCGKSAPTPAGSASTGTSGSSSATSSVTDPNRAVKAGDTVAVDYVGKLQDGTIFDSSIKAEAAKSANYNADRDYSPLLFTVGAGQMIKGFDKGVVGMKVGETRTLTIPPEEGYGTGGTEETVPKKALADTFTQTVSRDKYQDTVQADVPESAFTSQGKPVPKAGDTISAGGTSAKVVKVDNGTVTLSIDNRQNPFYGKKLAVGLTGDFEGNKVKITALDSKNVTVQVDNRNNPFYGKKLAVGLSAKWNGEVYTVKKIDQDTVTLEHAGALVGKTLIFDVTLKEIK
jgi:FKBP-type peptidyl-prolyl cis-trans isomerase 2